MIQRTLSARLLATGLILTLQMAWLPASADTESATVRGAILSATDQTPIAGARLHVGDPASGRIYTSSPASDDGSYSLTGVPPATYEVAVENQGRLYVVSTPLRLAPGSTRNVDLAVNPQAAPDPATAEAEAAKAAGSFWNNSLTAALIVLGAAIVVGVAVDAATDDDDGPMGSASNP